MSNPNGSDRQARPSFTYLLNIPTRGTFSPMVPMQIPIGQRQAVSAEPPPPHYERRTNALQGSFNAYVARSLLGAQEIQAAYLGSQLGWYESLGSSDEPLTALQLSMRTQSSERYVREWCEHQTLCGWIECVDCSACNNERRYYLLEEQRSVLLGNKDTLAACSLTAVLGTSLEKLKEAYKNDTGMSWNDYDSLVHNACSQMAQPSGTLSYMATFPDLQHKLQYNGGHVALVGSMFAGEGIDLAMLNPNILIDFFVPHQDLMKTIRGDLVSAGLEGRFTLHHLNLNALDDLVVPLPSFDFVRISDDCVNWDGLLKAAKTLTGQASTVLAEIPAIAKSFNGDPSDVVESLWYSHSLTLGLPTNKSYRHATEVGSTVRRGQFERMAIRAGFRSVTFHETDGDIYCMLFI